jgi:hypothetical protein
MPIQTINFQVQPGYQINPQNYQQNSQILQTPNPPLQSQQQGHQKTEPLRDGPIIQANIPNTTLANQVQNVLASLFNASQVSQSPLPTLITQQSSNSATNDSNRQATIPQDQTRDSAVNKTTEVRSEITKSPVQERLIDRAVQTNDTIKIEASIRVVPEPLLQPPLSNSQNPTAQKLENLATGIPANSPNSNSIESASNIAKAPTQVLPSLAPNNLDPTPQIIIGPRPFTEALNQTTQAPTGTQTSHSRQQQEESRSATERARDIQTVIIVGGELSRPSQPLRPVDPVSSGSTRQDPTYVFIERVRENIVEKLSSIQTRITSTPPEIQRQRELQGAIDNKIQGRDILRRPHELTTRENRPVLSTKLAERMPNNNQTPSNIAERIPNILALMKNISLGSVNFKLLGKMDTALEKACLTIISGTALGVAGVGLIYRALNLALLQTLGFLRDEDQSSKELGLISEQKELLKQLEEAATVEINSVGEQGFVVDLAGIVINAQNGSPINDVTVRSSEFGSCQTDTEGRFIFTNIPLGTPYTITVSSDNLKIKQVVIHGICGELEFLRINVVIV